MIRISKKQWLIAIVTVLLLAAPIISKRSDCLVNGQCSVEQKRVNWVNWLIGHSGGQLHFFDLLELFHKPNKANNF